MIQLMIRKPLGEINNLPTKKESKKEDVKEEAKKEEKVKVAEEAESKVYKVGDGLDVRDRETGIIEKKNFINRRFFAALKLNIRNTSTSRSMV